jgi:hypothetical protein
VDPRQRELVKKRLLSASEILHAEGLQPQGGHDACFEASRVARGETVMLAEALR